MRISSPDEGRLGCLGRAVVTVIILLVIVLVAGTFVVRTEGMRSYLEDRVEARLGVKVSVGSARIGLPYVVILRDVGTEGFDDGVPGFAVGEARISAVGLLMRKVVLQRLAVRVERTSDGIWKPEPFQRLGDLPVRNIGALTDLTAGVRDRFIFRIRHASLDWVNDKGQEMASATGVDFDVRPVEMPRHEVFYYWLRVDHAKGAQGGLARNVEMEWLASEEKECILIDRSGEIAETESGFWNAEGVRVDREK